MRVARQHNPLHLQVTRTNNGKFVVNQNVNGNNLINNNSNSNNNNSNDDREEVVVVRDEEIGENQLRNNINNGVNESREEENNDGRRQQQRQQRNNEIGLNNHHHHHHHYRRRINNNNNNRRRQENSERVQRRVNNNDNRNHSNNIEETNNVVAVSVASSTSSNSSSTSSSSSSSSSSAAAAAAVAAAVAVTATANTGATNNNTKTTLNNYESNVCQNLSKNSSSYNVPTLLGDRFLLVGPAEGSALYRCVDVKTGQQLVAKCLTAGDKGGQALLEAHLRLDGTGAASGVAGVVDVPGGRRYLLLEGHHGDLHAYVRARRRLREPEARRLFKQAAKAVLTCHDNGVVLRDLKLRKFVFSNESRTKLRLESLEDAVIVEEDNDKLADRRGCPAYVAPEVLRSGRAYSGKAADVWSLGVLLYTMLVGRYPFNDAEHASLFAKISRGQFTLPEGLSPRARCLVKALLRKEPNERPISQDVIRHPWLAKPIYFPQYHHANSSRSSHDQIVPSLSSLPLPSSSSSSLLSSTNNYFQD